MGSFAQCFISQNVDYNFDNFRQDLIIGVASFFISEGIVAFLKKILRSWFYKVASNTTKEAFKQLYRLLNDGVVENLKPNAENIIEIADLMIKLISLLEKGFGALYSFVTSIAHNTIINW